MWDYLGMLHRRKILESGDFMYCSRNQIYYLPGISIITNLSHRMNDQWLCMACVFEAHLFSQKLHIAHILGTLCSCKTMTVLSHVLPACCTVGAVSVCHIRASVSNVIVIFMHFADTYTKLLRVHSQYCVWYIKIWDLWL